MAERMPDTDENLGALDGFDIETIRPGAGSDADNIMSAADLDGLKNEQPPPKQGKQYDGGEPFMSSEEWPAFVLQHFTSEEVDEDKRPYVHGLRRVAKLLLGPIIKSQAKVIQAPTFVPGFDKLGILTPATVEHTVEILMCRVEHDGVSPYKATFTEASDVYHGNSDNMVSRHPTATASTRAEGRALRKALGLDRVIAAEESTAVPLEDSGIDGKITRGQITFLDTLCHRNDIDVLKFVNMGKVKYNRIDDVPHGIALLMIEHLSGLQNNQTKIDPKIKGYDSTWRN
jgi:hypothetical protein